MRIAPQTLGINTDLPPLTATFEPIKDLSGNTGVYNSPPLIPYQALTNDEPTKDNSVASSDDAPIDILIQDNTMINGTTNTGTSAPSFWQRLKADPMKTIKETPLPFALLGGAIITIVVILIVKKRKKLY